MKDLEVSGRILVVPDSILAVERSSTVYKFTVKSGVFYVQLAV